MEQDTDVLALRLVPILPSVPHEDRAKIAQALGAHYRDLVRQHEALRANAHAVGKLLRTEVARLRGDIKRGAVDASAIDARLAGLESAGEILTRERKCQ